MYKKDIYPISKNSEIVIREIKGEVLIYDLKSNEAYCLNETSALVWRMCDGEKNISEIAHLVGRKLNQPVSEEFILYAIKLLKEENLLQNGNHIKTTFDHLNRREAIRQVGLSSLIMLPVISTVVAPRAAQAASGQFANCANPALNPAANASGAPTGTVITCTNTVCATTDQVGCKSCIATQRPVQPADFCFGVNTFACVCT